MELLGFFIFLGLYCVAQAIRSTAWEEYEERKEEFEKQQPIRRIK